MTDKDRPATEGPPAPTLNSVAESASVKTQGHVDQSARETTNSKKWSRSDKIQVVIGLVGAFYCGITALLWYTTKVNFERQQRAWVGVVQMTLKEPITNGQFPGAEFKLINSGETPALRVMTKGQAFSADEFPLADPCPGPVALDAGSGSVIAPHGEHITRLALKPLQPRAYLYVCGTITYHDVFSATNQHSTTYCLYHEASDTTGRVFANCPNGNSMN